MILQEVVVIHALPCLLGKVSAMAASARANRGHGDGKEGAKNSDENHQNYDKEEAGAAHRAVEDGDVHQDSIAGHTLQALATMVLDTIPLINAFGTVLPLVVEIAQLLQAPALTDGHWWANHWWRPQ